MTAEAAAAKRPLCWPVLTDPSVLDHYRRALGIADPETALRALARAIAAGPGWEETSECSLLIRLQPRPALAVIGSFDADGEAWIAAQALALRRGCACLRYVDYARAQQDCAELAARLAERFGRQRLERFCFTAIPRGGVLVLGMLAYLLRLGQEQLQPPYPAETPLVVVDDCAFSGARFGRFLASCGSQQIIFAPLYSPPELRAAITAREPRVAACLSAQDMRDHGPERIGAEYPAWQERWQERLGGARYWFGLSDHVCFPWNEPDRSVWDPGAARPVPAWRIVPPELCLKNRPTVGHGVPVQVQPLGRGPLRPAADVLFGEFQGQIVIGNVRTGKNFGLADVAADMWQAIVEYGDLEEARVALRRDYDVDEDRLRSDLRAFSDDLVARGLLEWNDDPAR